jgi:hypothetical protein
MLKPKLKKISKRNGMLCGAARAHSACVVISATRLLKYKQQCLFDSELDFREVRLRNAEDILGYLESEMPDDLVGIVNVRQEAMIRSIQTGEASGVQ